MSAPTDTLAVARDALYELARERDLETAKCVRLRKLLAAVLGQMDVPEKGAIVRLPFTLEADVRNALEATK